MTVSLNELKQNLDQLVDEVIRTGIPVEIESYGHRLKLIIDEPRGKIARLRPHQSIVGDPEDLVDLRVAEWRETENL